MPDKKGVCANYVNPSGGSISPVYSGQRQNISTTMRYEPAPLWRGRPSGAPNHSTWTNDMGWEKRGDSWQYYQKMRLGTMVKSIYQPRPMGHALEAMRRARAEAVLETSRKQRRLEQEIALGRERLDAYGEAVDTLLAGYLIAAELKMSDKGWVRNRRGRPRLGRGTSGQRSTQTANGAEDTLSPEGGRP